MSLVPLSAYGKPYTPPAGKVDPAIDMKTAGARPGRTRWTRDAYFKLLAELMKTIRRPPADAPMVAKMAKIGIVPGQDFDAAKLDAGGGQGARRGSEARASSKIMALVQGSVAAATRRSRTAGCSRRRPALYGTELPPARARSPRSASAPTGRRTRSIRRPRPTPTASRTAAPTSTSMHFDKGQMPPVDGFWSLTMYDAEYFFVANPLNRYTVSARNKSQDERGRLGRPLHPERVAGQGQGSELAAGTEGQVHPDDAAVLADGERRRRSSTAPGRSRR